MAKSQLTSTILSALFFFCMLLIASHEMKVAEGAVRLCGRLSQTWTGFCGNTGGCNEQCRSWERAQSGACHRRGLIGFACFCYFNC
ncbi:defensin-like protein 1 [Andrographis paniculata]|uniref:defensin-like protein 1 n=1 Tax=Andrographis paniculata TaxID=175694 RepID=UPI0021E728DC|nr:defensin-like protein 1 [Andrographis paniculata]